MKKIFNKELAITLVISAVTIMGTISHINHEKQNEELRAIIADQETVIAESVNKIGELNKETEKLSVENADLTSNLESARQRNSEIRTEIEGIEKVEREFVLSRSSASQLYYGVHTDITKISIHNGDVLDLGLKGKLKGHGWDFVNAGMKHGVDPIFLAAISAQESGWGKYDHGRNNIFGIMSGEKSFASYYDCIEYTANLLSKYYIAEGRTTPDLIQPKYCPSPTNWDSKVADCANTIIRGF